jgi:hypothetical protein
MQTIATIGLDIDGPPAAKAPLCSGILPERQDADPDHMIRDLPPALVTGFQGGDRKNPIQTCSSSTTSANRESTTRLCRGWATAGLAALNARERPNHFSKTPPPAISQG